MAPTTRSRGGVKESKRTIVRKRPKAKRAASKTALIQGGDEIADEVTAGEDVIIRHDIESMREYTNHILFLFVGVPPTLVTLHTHLLPVAAREYIEDNSRHYGFYWLHDQLLETVELYRAFLYEGRFYSKRRGDQPVSYGRNVTEYPDAEWHRLVEMYLFGNTVGDENFANAAIDALIDKVDESETYPTSFAEYVYEHTGRGNALRRLLVDLHIWIGEGTGIQSPHDDADGPREFVRAVKAGLARLPEETLEQSAAGLVKKPWEVDRCAYHVHRATTCRG